VPIFWWLARENKPSFRNTFVAADEKASACQSESTEKILRARSMGLIRPL
jgi:hypothetical protein